MGIVSGVLRDFDDDHGAAHEWAAEHWAAFASEAKARHADALRFYTLDGYGKINHNLRKGYEVPYDARRAMGDLDEAFQMDSATMPEDAIVHRKIGGWPWLSRRLDSGKDIEGLVFQDPGYVSTSLDSTVPERFGWSTDPRPIYAEIHVPKGHPAIYVQAKGHTGKRAWTIFDQAEVLLPRNLSFRISHYSESDDMENRIVHLEIVNAPGENLQEKVISRVKAPQYEDDMWDDEAAFKFRRDQPRWPRGSRRGGQWRDAADGIMRSAAELIRFDESGRAIRHERKVVGRHGDGSPIYETTPEMMTRERGEMGQQAAQYLAEAGPLIRAVTGADESNWNGEVIIRSKSNQAEMVNYYGAKHPDCSISLREDAYGEPERRYTTLTHEYLHSLSHRKGVENEYLRNIGWEEAVIESLARSIYLDVAKQVEPSLNIEELRRSTDQKGIQKNHPYNKYIEATERLRELLGETGPDFYQELLRTPLEDRYHRVVRMGQELARTANNPNWQIAWSKELRAAHMVLSPAFKREETKKESRRKYQSLRMRR